MSALRTDIDRTALRLTGAESAAPPAREWFGLPEAAVTLGCSEGHLRRECPRLARQGLARKARVEGVRNARWEIHRAYHPALAKLCASAPGDGAAQRVAAPGRALLAATARRREDALRKAAWVRAFRAWRGRPGVSVARDFPAWAAQQSLGESPSLATLYRWNDAAPGEGDDAAVAAALLDERGGDPGATAKVGESAWAFFRGLYLTPHKLSIASCWRVTRARAVQMAAEEGWGWPSRRRVAELVRERISSQEIVRAREGEEAWSRQFKAPLDQAPDAWAAGERWDADHARFDFFVRVVRGGVYKAERPWLTAWIDWRTRRLVGWKVTLRPDAQSVRVSLLAALRAGVSPPAIAWMDNGKDFDSAAITGRTKRERRASRLGAAHTTEATAMHGLLGLLGIEPRFAQPYNHNGKARVERLFATMHMEFDRRFSSWCGSKPGDRDRDSLDEALADPAALPTLEEIERRFAEWAEWYNHRSEHNIDDLVVDGDRLSPAAAYERLLPARRVLPDEGVLALLEQRWSRPLAVGKRGVGFVFRGKKVWYGSTEPMLQELKGSGRRVFVTLDPADVSSVRIYDEAMRFVCTAALNGHYGGRVSKEAMDAALAERRAHARRLREKLDATALLGGEADAAAAVQRRMDVEQEQARMRAAGVAEPPALRVVRTPLDGQAERVKRVERRMAVGAEAFGAEPDETIDLTNMTPSGPAFAGQDEAIDFTNLLDTDRPCDEEPLDLGALMHETDDDDDGPIDILGALDHG